MASLSNIQKLETIIDRSNPIHLAIYNVIKSLWDAGDLVNNTLLADIIKEFTSGSGTTFSNAVIFSLINTYSNTTGITTTGTNYATAVPLTTELNNVTLNTAGGGAEGVSLYIAAAGKKQIVFNNSPTTIKIYPITSSYIDGVQNTGITLQVGEMVVFTGINSTHWVTNRIYVNATTGTITTLNTSSILVTKGTIGQTGAISTAVTLNKSAGTITTVANYGLVAGSNVAFTVNNSYCLATSVIPISVEVVTDIPPIVTVESKGLGTFVIRLYNTSAIDITAGQIKIDFNII